MDDPHLNQLLGPYRLKKVVGRGGMGTVYASTDDQKQPVAVKVLSPILATDPSFRERFMSEIDSLKKLRHANIVQLIGWGEQDGQLFYVMELIEGTSLQQELHEGRRFSWRDITRITIEICAALKHAHDHGIIHRDLKPANLLLTRDESIKLLDFGIAKLFGNTGVTTGSVMGTADYMAPEQAEGKAVGPRTDLYSLGSVMYALLSGRPPFMGKSVPEVVHKVRFEPPIPISRIANDVPSELEHVIEQLLEKNPQKRIPTALALSHRLKAMEHALSIRGGSGSTDTTNNFDLVQPSDKTAAGPGLSSQVTVRLPDEGDERPSDVTFTTRDSDIEVEIGPDHYTSVEKEKEERANRERIHVSWPAIGSLMMLLGLLSVGWLLVNQARKPASADVLYERIIAAQEKSAENPRAILDVEQDLDLFLATYGDDPRRNELGPIREEIELARFQRKLEAKARRRNSRSESPVEQLYLDIIRQLRNDPDIGARRLRAFVELHSELDPDATEVLEDDERRVVGVASKLLVQLEQQGRDAAEIHGPLIQRQLQTADDLEASDPIAANRIRQRLRELYRGKQWAEQLLPNEE